MDDNKNNIPTDSLSSPGWLLNLKSFVLGFFCCVILFNIFVLTSDMSSKWGLAQRLGLRYFPGLQFAGLKDLLKGVQYIGYYSDKNLDDRVNAAQFSQAQYVLAPIIMDLNNTNHEYIIFDCTNERIAFAKIKEIGAVPLKKNPLGVILAQRVK